MKQEITTWQLDDLTPKQMEKLYKWCTKYEYPTTLSIGQMVEFLTEKLGKGIGIYGVPANGPILKDGGWDINDPQQGKYLARGIVELCDALWEAAKEVLDESN